MIIPDDEEEKQRKLKYIVDQCLLSQIDRYNNYINRRRYFLFGTAEQSGKRVLYNKLQAHTDLVASFLYAADTADYSISGPHNSSEEIVSQMDAVEEEWNDEFRDSGLAYQYESAILWSLVYDSMFLKIGWNRGRKELTSVLIPPYNFGVYDESEPDLDSQQAFVHTYTVDYDWAKEALIRGGMTDKIPQLRANVGQEASPFPEPLNLIIANNQRTRVTDPIVGRVMRDYRPTYSYQAKEETDRVRINEVWVWDDLAMSEDGEQDGDYRMFRMIEPDIILEDSKESIEARIKAKFKRSGNRYFARGIDFGSLHWTQTNDFLPGEHPFVHVRPFSLYDYFFGECHSERLIPLQDWVTVRLDEIHEILEMQIDPPKIFSGFMGLTDEKADVFRGPGAWVYDMQPNAQVQRFAPDMPEDLFAEYEAIGKMFEEASGLTPTVTGKGEQGVRGRGHAKQLATTGSSRIRKTAVGLEPSLIEAADKSLKILCLHDARPLRTATGMDFTFRLLAADWRMRIAGHSHSPLFADEGREAASMLLQAQAIDLEDFLKLMHPPGRSKMVHKLRRRQQRQAEMIQKHPELLLQQGGGGRRKKPTSPLALAS